MEFGNFGFEVRGNSEYPKKKTLGAKEKTKNNVNPRLALTLEFEPGPHWWERQVLS